MSTSNIPIKAERVENQMEVLECKPDHDIVGEIKTIAHKAQIVRLIQDGTNVVADIAPMPCMFVRRFYCDPNYAEVTLPNKRKTSPIEQPTAPGKTACSSAKRVGDDDSDTQASAAGDTDVDDEPDAMARRRGIPVYQSYGGCRPTVKPWREDSTADVNTIFRRVMGHKHLKTGVLEDGAICLICTHDGHSPAGCFMTGNVTSLRLHITRLGKLREA
ncbi:hypothetical protein C8R46DRAFT_1222747 [Mycena filopes]|nr:hypothetical protein C8R46DRAFT_1222747 [Mycena filopes]